MNVRDEKILEAAKHVFFLYGVAKTTMADIAKEAGVSRQTIYNAYPGKDDILRAAVEFSFERSYTQAASAWAAASGFAEKLDVFFQFMPLGWYDATAGNAHREELAEGVYNAAGDVVDGLGRKWRDLICSELTVQMGPADDNHWDMADYIFATAVHAKYGAADRDTLVSRLQFLKASVLALIAERST